MPPLRSSCEEGFTQMEDADWGVGVLLQPGAEQPGSLPLPASKLPAPSTQQWAFIQNGRKIDPVLCLAVSSNPLPQLVQLQYFKVLWEKDTLNFSCGRSITGIINCSMNSKSCLHNLIVVWPIITKTGRNWVSVKANEILWIPMDLTSCMFHF